MLVLAVLLDVVQSIFLGPVAVGLGLGALLVAKGFIGGALIAGRRSRSSYRYSTFSMKLQASIMSYGHSCLVPIHSDYTNFVSNCFRKLNST